MFNNVGMKILMYKLYLINYSGQLCINLIILRVLNELFIIITYDNSSHYVGLMTGNRASVKHEDKGCAYTPL